MKSYPLFRKENIPAYFVVMGTWAAVSVVSGGVLSFIMDSGSLWKAIIWAAATAMAGMAIMFTASVINLRKLAPGFRRMAEGNKDPQIPPVWCPVLTAATNAAVELVSRQGKQEQQ